MDQKRSESVRTRIRFHTYGIKHRHCHAAVSYTHLKVKDNNVKFLIQFNNFFRIANASPRKVCNVDQTVYAAKVDEYTVRCDIFNRCV